MRAILSKFVILLGILTTSVPGNGAWGAEHEDSKRGSLKVVQELDQSLPVYHPHSDEMRGQVVVVCSQLMEPLLHRWRTEFEAKHPNVKVTPKPTENDFDVAIISPTVNSSSYLFEGSGMTPEALSILVRGNDLWPVVIGFDRLEVIVHRSNVTEKISIDQLAWAMSKQGRSAARVNSQDQATFLDHPQINDWKDLGAENLPTFASAPIRVYGRGPATQDYEFVTSQILGTFAGTPLFTRRIPRNDITTVETANAMIHAVENDHYGIGYVSHSLLKDVVRTVPIVERSTELWPSNGVEIEQPYVMDLTCLVRPVHLWIRPSSNHSESMLQGEFLRYILSREGQTAVVEKGFFPLSLGNAKVQLQAVTQKLKSK